MDIGVAIRQAIKNRNLVELVVRESMNGYQVIAKYAETVSGPWGVSDFGLNGDPILAIEEALRKGAIELERVRLERAKPKLRADDLL